MAKAQWQVKRRRKNRGKRRIKRSVQTCDGEQPEVLAQAEHGWQAKEYVNDDERSREDKSDHSARRTDGMAVGKRNGEAREEEKGRDRLLEVHSTIA